MKTREENIKIITNITEKFNVLLNYQRLELIQALVNCFLKLSEGKKEVNNNGQKV